MAVIYPILAAAVVAADQITKYLIRSSLALGERIPVFKAVLGDWFNITYIRNTGTAFSMFAGNKMVTVVLTSLLIVFCIVVAVREFRKGSRLLALCLTFVMAGGVSNMIDRLCFGYVTDMISCGSFAIFNVADIAVTCGCFTAMIIIAFFYKEDKSKEAADE